MTTDDSGALGSAVVSGAEPAAGTGGSLARYREFVPALAGMLIAGFTLVLSRALPSGEARSAEFGPAWWPVGLSGLLVVLGVLQSVRAWRHARTSPAAAARDDAPRPATREGAVRLVLMLAAIGGYGVLWYYIDFRVSTTILFVVLSFVAGVRGVKALLLFPILATAVLWLLFGVLLRVPI